MNKKNIRTKYIKSLIDDKEELSNILKECTKDSIKSLIDESVNQNLREMLAEADEKYEEEEVETPDEDTTKIETSKEEADNNEEENEETSNETEKEEEQTIDNADEFEEVWKEFSDDQNEDGEYDLRGKDIDTLFKVLQAMTDGINIHKNSDGTVTLTQDGEEEGKVENSEITINIEDNNDDDKLSDEEDDEFDLDGFNFDDIDNESDDDSDDEEDEDGELTFEIEPDDDDDEVLDEQDIDLGYTTTYQKDSAVIMPKDRDVEITIEDGIPRGVENDTRRYGKPQNPSTSKPYTRPVNYQKTNPCEKDLANISKETDEINNKVKKILTQANALIKENKELKKIASQIKEKLNESVVINSSLAKVIKLITENSTTKDEKIDMIQRFNKVKNLNQCESLYETISLELKNTNSVNKGKLLDQQLTENKTQKNDLIVETNMLNQSKDLQQMLSLQKRMDNI